MKYRALLLLTILSLSSCATLNQIGIKPSTLETVLALKEVLNSSTYRTISTLKKLNDGGVENILPEQMGAVLSGLNMLGYSKEVEQINQQITQASKIALTESEGIIKDAVSELKFSDAAAVVLGGEDAATGVLKSVMYTSVKKRYSAQLEEVLAQQEASQYWPIAANAYNLFADQKVDSSLSDFLAERAVDALFIGIGKNEKAIRSDYKSLGKQVVTKVFDYYTKK